MRSTKISFIVESWLKSEIFELAKKSGILKFYGLAFIAEMSEGEGQENVFDEFHDSNPEF